MPRGRWNPRPKIDVKTSRIAAGAMALCGAGSLCLAAAVWAARAPRPGAVSSEGMVTVTFLFIVGGCCGLFAYRLFVQAPLLNTYGWTMLAVAFVGVAVFFALHGPEARSRLNDTLFASGAALACVVEARRRWRSPTPRSPGPVTPLQVIRRRNDWVGSTSRAPSQLR